MKKIKKLTSVILTAILAFGAFAAVPVTANAEEISGDFEYYIEEYYDENGEPYDVAVVTAYYGESSEVVIPETLDGYPVKTIENVGVDGDIFKITSAVIPKTVEMIYSWAFDNCWAIEKVEVNEQNERYASIDGVLFSKDNDNGDINCIEYYPREKKGSAYSIPDGVKEVSGEAFSYCSYLEEINIPRSLEFLSGDGCYNPFPYGEFKSFNVDPANKNYTSVDGVIYSKDMKVLYSYPNNKDCEKYEIINGTERIADEAFAGAWYLSEILIPDSVFAVGYGAFEHSPWGEKLDSINEASIYVGKCLYKYNDEFADDTVLKLKEGTRGIADGAVFDSKITEIIFSDELEVIGEDAFAYCKNLKAVVIPNKVKYIGEWAFHYCENLEEVTLPESLEKIGYDIFEECQKLRKIYYNCDDAKANLKFDFYKFPIEEVVFGDNVTHIYDNFAGCSSLKKVSFGKNLEKIGNAAFYYCTSLKNIVIPNGVKYIGDWAFAYCENLEEVTLPETLEETGYLVFTDCFNIKKVYYNCDGTNQIGDGFGFYFEDVKEVIYGDNVTYIDGNGFSDIEKIVIGKNVKEIGEWAFSNTSSLKEITIPSNVNIIGFCSFADCSSLEKVTIEDGVTTIDDYSFHDCLKLKSIEIPSSVTTIGNEALGYYAIYDDDDVAYDDPAKIEDFTIYGKKGTEAERYALENGFTFIETGKAQFNGDLNGDGSFDISDCTLLQKKLAGYRVDIIGNADADGNGNLSIIDVTYMQKKLAGLN